MLGELVFVGVVSLQLRSSLFDPPKPRSDPLALLWWLVLFIEALVLFPNIEREGSQQWRANLKGDN